MISAILFDYDDTLAQTKEAKFSALRTLGARHYDKRLTDDDIWPHWGIAYEELFRALFADVEPTLSRAIERYEALDTEFPIQPYPEALAVLAELETRLPIGIVTSAGKGVVIPQLQRMGVNLE